jgi:hypothetical protein
MHRPDARLLMRSYLHEPAPTGQLVWVSTDPNNVAVARRYGNEAFLLVAGAIPLRTFCD